MVLIEKPVGNKNTNQDRELLSEKSASQSSVCEHFPEVGVSRRGMANVLECLVADAQLN